MSDAAREAATAAASHGHLRLARPFTSRKNVSVAYGYANGSLTSRREYAIAGIAPEATAAKSA
jgi:hypothetical protein